MKKNNINELFSFEFVINDDFSCNLDISLKEGASLDAVEYILQYIKTDDMQYYILETIAKKYQKDPEIILKLNELISNLKNEKAPPEQYIQRPLGVFSQ